MRLIFAALYPTSVISGERQLWIGKAAVKALLKLLTLQVNILLAAVALVCLFAWLITEQHTTMTALIIAAWAFHMAVMLTVDIAKGGAEL